MYNDVLFDQKFSEDMSSGMLSVYCFCRLTLTSSTCNSSSKYELRFIKHIRLL